MPAESFPTLLRLAVAVFMILLPLLQWLALRDLARRGEDDVALHARNVRDHVLGAMARAALVAMGMGATAALGWLAIAAGSLGWGSLVGVELVFAFAVLALGFTVAALRFGLRLMERVSGEAAPGALVAMRLALLAVGGAYGAALWILVPGSAGENLLAVFLLGGALFVLGLNRTAGMDPGLVRRLSRAWRGETG